MYVQSFVARVSSAAIAVALIAATAPAIAQMAVPILPPPPFVVAPRTVNGWGFKFTDVTPDPAIRYGRLPNGMKYAIMHNATPKGTASVQLQIAFGSIGEAESERGLAHFLEHMAFEGSTHVAQGDMVKMLERQGLSFGADTNAFTGFDTTSYILELPQTDPQHVDTALFLFRELTSELKFDPSAVDRERSIILGEERSRNSFELHQSNHLFAFEYPQTPYPNRTPIGLDTVIKSVSAAGLRELYHRYYRPKNATLVFVGDADPAEIEAKIMKTFSDWRGIGPAGAPLPRGKVDFARPASFSSFADPAVATSVNYTVTRRWKDLQDTLAERRHRMLLGLAEQIFNRRLQRLADAPGSPLLGGNMVADELRGAAFVSTVAVAARDGAWKEALTATEQELRRALQYGFTATEFTTESSNAIGALHSRMAESDTRANGEIAANIISTVSDHGIVTAPRTMMPISALLLKSASLTEVNAAFRELWTGSQPLIHVSAKQEVPIGELAAAFQASLSVALAGPKDNGAQAFAYDNFGKSGAVVEDKRIADLDVRTIRFANNVRLNIKKTDFEANKIRFLVRLGDGLLDLPKDEPGLATMLTVTSSDAGLKKHSLEDLKDMFAGKIISVGTAVDADAFVAAGETDPKDLPLQMKVSTAYLTEPGFRKEAANKWATVVPLVEKQIDAEPESVAANRLPVLLASGDPLFGVPPEPVLSQRTFGEASAALAPVIASGPIEITIVGDVDENAAIAAVAESFGALPARSLTGLASPDARNVTFRSDLTPILLKHDGPADKALVESVWPTTNDSDFRELAHMELLRNVLDIMLRESVREKLGDSYVPSVQNYMSHQYPGFGYISAAAVVAPDKVDEVQKAIADAAAELRSQPISDDLLARARNPLLQQLDKSVRNNLFWISVLATTQSEPALLDRVRQRKALLEEVKAADLQKLAQKYLQPARLQKVLIISSKTPTITASR